MKRLALILLLAFLGSSTYAQDIPSIVKGRILDKDREPIIYAVAVIQQKGKNVAGAPVDSTGRFLLMTELTGVRHFKACCLGYKDHDMDIDLDLGTVMDLGNIILEDDEEMLMLLESVVTSEPGTPSGKMTVERTRIDPSSSAVASTGSVLEIIRGASAVTVDGNDNVSIRGNSNVLILVDGVPTALGGLGAIPAANVQNIEIVTSPDVKYDAEGTGGIISIMTKKQSQNMFNAMASFNYGFNGFLNGNFAASWNVGRWGLRFNYNGRYENDHIESELHRRIKSTGSGVDQIISATKRTSNQNAGLNAVFKATKSDILTLDFKAIFPRMNNLQDFDNHYVSVGASRDLSRQTDITFNRETFEGSLGYRHIFQPHRKELGIVGTVSKITGHRPSFYYEEGEMVQKSVSGGHPFNTSLQVDFMSSPGNLKFETGARMTYRRNNIDHKMYEIDPVSGEWSQSIPLSDDLKHREYIPAAYAMLSSGTGGALDWKAGIRAEYSHVSLHSEKEMLDDHSDCWFVAPNVMLEWKPRGPWKMSFGLSRRISRPTYPQLNPYINLIDNSTYETGNVNLQPEKANKLDLGYSFFSGKVRIAGNAYASYTTGCINQVAGLRDDILVMTYINSDMDLKTGIDHSITLSPLRWMNIDIATNTYFTKTRGSYEGAEILNGGWVNNSNVTLGFKPVKGMNLQAQYFVTTPQYFPQFTTKTIHYGNLGVTQAFLKRALVISATLTDVFGTRCWDISSDNSVYSLVNNSRNLSRVFWLGITWNFNSYKPLKGQQKKQEEDRSVLRLGD